MLLPNFLSPLRVTRLNTFTLLAVFFVLHHCLFHPCWSVVLFCICFPSPAPLPFLLPSFYAPQPLGHPPFIPDFLVHPLTLLASHPPLPDHHSSPLPLLPLLPLLLCLSCHICIFLSTWLMSPLLGDSHSQVVHPTQSLLRPCSIPNITATIHECYT